MKGVGFSLWVVPGGEARHRLAALVAALARRFGGPVFDPHVTLLAALPGPVDHVVARVSRVVGSSKAFSLRFVGPEVGDTYFRSLYLPVEPSPELLALHEAARDAIGGGEEPASFPHLSLMYGPPPPRAVIEEVRRSAPDGFEARTVEVYATEGEVERWHRVRRLRLR